MHLGRLWSGNITRKTGRRVIDTGPYALVRHPIYTGLLLALRHGDEINIHNFGRLTVVHRPARQGRNPRTGDAIQLAARITVKFKQATALIGDGS